jgi:hypothetical protein
MALRDWIATHPPKAERFTQTFAGISDRVRDGDDFRVAVREFLDEFDLRPRHLRGTASADRPAPTGDARFDAFLGALAEHLAIRDGLAAPDWVNEEAVRFLDRMWFVSETPGFRAIAIARSPMAFRRRGIFVPADSLKRV